MFNHLKKRSRANLEEPFRVLLPLTNLDEARALLPIAEAVVQEMQGQLMILHILVVPEGTHISESASEASRFREALDIYFDRHSSIPTQIQTIVRSAVHVWEGIWSAVAQEQIDLLFLSWRTPYLQHSTVAEITDHRLGDPPCAVAAVRPGELVMGPQGWQATRRILLPVRGGPNSALTLRVGYALAQKMDSAITLLHVTAPGRREAQVQFHDEFSPAINGLENITRTVTSVGEIANTIVAEAENHQVIVMGAPSQPISPDQWRGPLLDNVVANTQATIVVVKDRRPASVPIEHLEPPAVQIERPVAVVVDHWFAENTFHSAEFANLERLLTLKKAQNLTISLGLPALNEQETVGSVIRTLKTALMDEIPLLDEIVLIDSGSVDYTREIAIDLGIPVYVHQEILPQYGSYQGKGEALWKSLYVLKGDIVAWVDTDIKNIHPRFVYGILGPLLRVSKIHYVKGFYRRPLREGDRLVAGGGGRVTELTARPFINLFFPELSGLIQPLSGEYAGRRQALEKMPFFTGYGVETGLIIDLLEEFGLNAIGQVDLLERIHHNQPLPNLSKMSFSIMQVVFSRLEMRHKIRLLEEANLTMNLVRYGLKRRYYLQTEEIRERERPPMLNLPEYRSKRGLPGRQSGSAYTETESSGRMA